MLFVIYNIISVKITNIHQFALALHSLHIYGLKCSLLTFIW